VRAPPSLPPVAHSHPTALRTALLCYSCIPSLALALVRGSAALSRSPSIGTFWAISVPLPDPQIIDLLIRADGRRARSTSKKHGHDSADAYLAADAVLVGLRPPDGQNDPLPDSLEVDEVDSSEFRASETACKSDQQQRPISEVLEPICVVPATSFCEYADTKPRKTPKWFALGEDRPVWHSPVCGHLARRARAKERASGWAA
jgi:hypothetical protein